MQRKIYVASSWRNQVYPGVLEVLRAEGHACYDFRNPTPNNSGFGWSELDANWERWTLAEYVRMLTTHPRAAEAFALDQGALDWADTCVLVLPSGRSAHLECGYCIGRGKPAYILLNEAEHAPELMYLCAARIVTDLAELVTALREGA
jgi:hypothetical protein